MNTTSLSQTTKGRMPVKWNNRYRNVPSVRTIRTWSAARNGHPGHRYLIPRLPLSGGISVIAVAGICYLSTSTPRNPIKADSPRSSITKAGEDVSSPRVIVTVGRRSAHTTSKPDHSNPGEQKPPPQTRFRKEAKDDPSKPEPDDDAGWNNFFSKLTSVQWASIPDKLTDMVVPDWIRVFPAYMNKFQDELSMAPGSLAEEIWQEANDPECNPEITWGAQVRVSDELCQEEKSFLEQRRHFTHKSLAAYLDIPEEEIHPEDVPVIAMCGSGGGLRALVAGAGSYLAAREAGLFDCITYTAGVSGSCWLQTLYYSSLGKQDYSRIIRHLKNRLGVHIAYPPAALQLINSAPTNKFLLTGLVEKLKGMPEADFGIVDVYGMLLAARLLVPKADLGVDLEGLKISSQQTYIKHGQNPLPIYTAVRHEIPPLPEKDAEGSPTPKEAWFQWFEFTPYEFWSEEAGAGIPIWAVGRQFEGGKTVWRSNGLSLPEQRLPLLLGIWGSAFCATLSHYYKEIRPVMKGLAGFGGVDQMIAERDEDLVKVHPIDPAAIPNYTLGMEGMLPSTCPESLYTTTHLQLMDAGMSNNLPIYPLLRPGRDVDVIIAFDASADVKTDNWLKVVDGYARQRDIKGWPIGAGWPPPGEPSKDVSEDLEKAQARSKSEADQKVEEAKADDKGPRVRRPPGHEEGDLGYCNVWVGSTAERKSLPDSPHSKLVEEDWEIKEDDAGMTVIYFPLLANDRVEGVDPKLSDFLSTWNFVYTPEQVEQVLALARANFDEGNDQTKRTIRAVYERKKKLRLEREGTAKGCKKSQKLRSGVPVGRKLGQGDHADQFS